MSNLRALLFVSCLVFAGAPSLAHAEPAAAEETSEATTATDDEDVAEERAVARRTSRVRNAPWVRSLPAPLRARGPFGMLYVDFIALVLLVPLSVLLSLLTFFPIKRVVARITARTKSELDDALAPAIAPYARGLLALGLFHLGVAQLSLPRRPAERLADIERLVLVGFLIFGFVRIVRVIGDAALRSSWGGANPTSRSLVPIAMRAGDVLAWIAAFLASLSMLGFDIGGLLAGLGVGGVIVALAAQKTVENVIGAFALGFDQPIREGDGIAVDGRQGTVERIGLRSTRIRTLDRTVVCIPNARLADMSIESFAARDRVRVNTVIGLAYDTPPETVRRVRDGIVEALKKNEKLADDPMIVRMRGFSATALEIEIMAWFEGHGYADLAEIREGALLDVIEAVRANGGELAVPARPAAQAPPPAPTAQVTR
jgi:MscS family membrane protein